jgi:hypothetical protein
MLDSGVEETKRNDERRSGSEAHGDGEVDEKIAHVRVDPEVFA